MGLNIFIPRSLKIYFDIEIKQYQSAVAKRDLYVAWRHLERAHILGQSYPYTHSYAHWKMLMFGLKIKSLQEVFGQIPRLLVGGVKSFVGIIPIGNPGGANVSPLQAFPIEDELKEIFKKAGIDQKK